MATVEMTTDLKDTLYRKAMHIKDSLSKDFANQDIKIELEIYQEHVCLSVNGNKSRHIAWLDPVIVCEYNGLVEWVNNMLNWG